MFGLPQVKLNILSGVRVDARLVLSRHETHENAQPILIPNIQTFIFQHIYFYIRTYKRKVYISIAIAITIILSKLFETV